MKEAPLLRWEGGHRRAAHNTEAETQQPTFSRLYLKGTAKPTLDTAFSLLSVEIKRLNTTKADRAILFSLLFYVNFTICFSISIRLSSEILIGIFFLTGNMFNLQIIFKRNDMVTILIFSSHENSIYYVAIYLFLSISFFSLDRIINIV